MLALLPKVLKTQCLHGNVDHDKDAETIKYFCSVT